MVEKDGVYYVIQAPEQILHRAALSGFAFPESRDMDILEAAEEVFIQTDNYFRAKEVYNNLIGDNGKLGWVDPGYHANDW